MSVENGYWQSPPFGVTPHQYYRLTFQSHAQVPGYWASMFFAADGQMLPADHNSGIFQTDDWIENDLYFQGKAGAASARLWFFPVSPKDGHAICIRNVTLATATDQQVLDWADRLYATLPPVQYQPPGDRWTLIPRTMHQAEPIRSVIRQIRAQCDAEILLTTAPIAQDKLIIENYAKEHEITLEEAAAIRKAFLEAVEKLAEEDRVEFLHLRKLWNEYLAAQQHDVTWFMRDVTHANVRGAQVVARMLEKYFASAVP